MKIKDKPRCLVLFIISWLFLAAADMTVLAHQRAGYLLFIPWGAFQVAGLISALRRR